MMDNKGIAIIFFRIADALEIRGANVFRIRAYRTAAQNISNLSRQLADICSQDKAELDNVSGIGKDLKGKIVEIVESGSLRYYDDLMREFPEGFLDLLDLSGLGPKKLKKLGEELGVRNIDDLEEACNKGKLKKIEGMGTRTEEKLLEAIRHFRKRQGRMLLPEADRHAGKIITYLSSSKNFKKIVKAGSLRRGKETVGDLDILAVAGDTKKAMEYFVDYPATERVIATGKTKSSITIKGGPQVDLRVVDSSCFGAALIYFTGSKFHNVKMRQIAKKGGYKVNEYGIFSAGASSNKKNILAGKTEEDVYDKLGMQWIPPELRENRGEVEAALLSNLPEGLLKIKDIKGDLHMHSTASDGNAEIEDIAARAMEKGYKYVAVTDHSKYVRIAGGMDEREILKHAEKVRRINQQIKGIEVLVGVEVDVLKDGRLDLADHALKEMDIVIAAVHSYFGLDKEKQTARILRGMDNKYVNILAHPSGRLITSRSAIHLNFDKIFSAASARNIFLELNTHGDRIDLNDVHCRRAKELGASFVINTDAHDIDQLDEMIYGVITARRGWLEKKDVLNTHSFDKMEKLLRK